MAQHTRSTPILVVGGCGFIGYHITSMLVADPFFGPVQVASRTPKSNLVQGAGYHAVDICSTAQLEALFELLKPRVVIHCASPSPTSGTASAFQKVTIEGTKRILGAARQALSVQALIFASSTTMGYGHEHINRREDEPLADEDPHAHPYAKTKAVADKLVLAANRPPQASNDGSGYAGSLLTTCLRFPLVYGERDLQAIPPGLAALAKGATQFQVGDDLNLWEVCMVENAAKSHMLAAKALLGQLPAARGHKIDGEAFNISDEDRRTFWTFARTIWKCAGWDAGPDGKGGRTVFVIPNWMALMISVFLEWVYWIFTLGTKRPGNLGTQQVQYFCYEHTYSIEKAKRRLGFVPRKGFEEGMQRGVDWCLREEGWDEKLRGRIKKTQ